MNPAHTPVLLNESIKIMNVGQKKGTWVDATFGGGGHSAEILKRMKKGSRLVALDVDRENLEKFSKRFSRKSDFTAVHSNFSEIKTILKKAGVNKAEGILFDLGVSSMHFDTAERGFSFTKEAPLDMRMDTGSGFTAYDVVNGYSKKGLARIFREYGGERRAGKTASYIINSRPVKTTTRLAEIIKKAAPGRPPGRKKTHPATGVFQALRMEVNSEISSLEKGLEGGLRALAPGGRMVVISFHSTEDRVVKYFFNRESKDCICCNKRLPCVCGHKKAVRVITKKPLTPTEGEKKANPRSSSARLRAAEKI